MLLLDTNALLWVLADDPALGPQSRAMVTAQACYYSAATAFEVVIKHMLGKLEVPGSLVEAAGAAGLRELPFTAQHAEAIQEFPDLVRHDPFDRMILAQARVEGMTLLTSDSVLLGIPGVETLDAHR